jgi:uncharacterized protein YhjY with autotransporter beta-barrel domain
MHTAQACADATQPRRRPVTAQGKPAARALSLLLFCLLIAGLAPTQQAVGQSDPVEVRVLAQPDAIFSEERSTSGIRFRTFTITANGLREPLPRHPVGAHIASGNASFLDGSGLQQVVTDDDGFGTTQALQAGRNAQPILVRLISDAGEAAEVVIGVRPSQYSIEAVEPSRVLSANQSTELIVRLRRQGSGAAVAVPSARVEWSASGGSLGALSSVSDSGGLARTSFRATNPGTYAVNAEVNPGPGLPTLSARFDVLIAAPALRFLSGEGQVAQAGQALPQPMVLGAFLGALPQAGVEISLEAVPAGAAQITPPRQPSGADGQARFEVVLSPNAQGSVSLVARRSDLPALSVTTTIRVGLPPRLRELLPVTGSGQAAAPGSTLPLPLTVLALDDGLPAAGVSINFSASPSEAAQFNPSSGLSDATGRFESRVTLGANASGPVRIEARRSDDASVVADFLVFAATTGQASLEIEAGNNQRGLTGSRAADLVVLHTVGGIPAPAVGVQWSVVTGSASLDATNSLTDNLGRARIGLRFGSSAGPLRVRAEIAGLRVEFQLEAIEGRLQIASGQGQQAPPGTRLPQALVVQLLPQAVAGVNIEWRVLEGGGQLSATTTPTDALGRAQVEWTLGSSVGVQRVAARLPGGLDQIFTADAVATGGSLEIVSGSGQNLVTASASEPLVVRALDAAGRPQAGRRVRWSSATATLEASETLTGTDGRSSQRIRIPLPGEARVLAQLEGSTSSVEFVLNGGISAAPGLAPTERAVASALDRGCSAVAALPSRTPAQQDLFARCAEFADAAGRPGSGLGVALDQLQQDVGLGLARAGDEAVRSQIGNLDQRLRALRAGGGERVQVDLGLLGPGGRLPLSALPGLAAAADGEDVERELGADFDRWGAFPTGTVGQGRSRGSGPVRFDYSLGSLTAGVDRRFGGRAVLGAALGLYRYDTDFAAERGSLESRGHNLSVYASFWLPREMYLDASLMRGRLDFDLERRIAYQLGSARIDQRAFGNTEGDQQGASLALGRDFARGAFSYGAYLRGQWSRIEYDPFEERMVQGQPGFGLGLRVRSPTWNSLEAIAGGRASYVLSRNWGILTPSLLLEYGREFRDDPSRLELSFIHDPTATAFGQSAAAIDRSYMNLGFGLSALWPGGRAAFLQYERRLFDDRVDHWTLSLGGRLEF